MKVEKVIGRIVMRLRDVPGTIVCMHDYSRCVVASYKSVTRDSGISMRNYALVVRERARSRSVLLLLLFTL